MLTKNLWNDFQIFMNFRVVFLEIVVFGKISYDHWICFIPHILKHRQNIAFITFIQLFCSVQIFFYASQGKFPFIYKLIIS